MSKRFILEPESPREIARLVSLLETGEVLCLDHAWPEKTCEDVLHVCYLQAREARGTLTQEEAELWTTI
jgi:hypothetical protein